MVGHSTRLQLSQQKPTPSSAVRPWFIQFVRMTSGLLCKTKLKKVRELVLCTIILHYGAYIFCASAPTVWN